jgi:uncharacterized protein YciI
MRLPFAATCLLLPLALSAATPPEAAVARDHTFAFLRLGPKRAEVQGEALQEAMRGHMANIGRLAAEKKLALAGPFGSPTPEPALRGIFVFFTADVSAAAALCQTDPSIAAGVLAAEVVPFRTSKDLAEVLRRALAFEERRKADPSIKMTEGMSSYVMVFADDFARAAAALAPLRAKGSIALEGSLGGARAGQGIFVLDAKDVAAGEALLAPLGEGLGTYRLFPWYGSVELKRGLTAGK